MRLVDLEPRWAIDTENRHGMAISFWCPCCIGTDRAQRLAVWFENPIDGLPKTDEATKWWQRSGDTFDTLTLSPSIDASEHGHWHGFIENGAVR